MHRIVHPLAQGKVVISERSGISADEEELFGGAVVFEDTEKLFSTALMLLEDRAVREKVLMEAMVFVAKEYEIDFDHPPSSSRTSSKSARQVVNKFLLIDVCNFHV